MLIAIHGIVMSRSAVQRGPVLNWGCRLSCIIAIKQSCVFYYDWALAMVSQNKGAPSCHPAVGV